MTAAAHVLLPGSQPVPLPIGGILSFGRTSTPHPPSPRGPHGGLARNDTQRRLVDLEVSASPRVSRRAGTLEATPFGVLLTNTGSNPLLVDETGVNRHTLRPGQVHLMASGRARVGFAGTDEGFELEVAVGSPVAELARAAEALDEATAERTRPAWSLAEGTAYFACLVALCEPTLLHPDSPWIPTSQQVADRLVACGVVPGPRSGDWVDRRLDDVREKLPIGERPWSAERARRATPEEQQQAMARARSGAPRRAGRKEQLVEFAVSSGIVTLETVHRVLGR